jgi:hypothetical protein
MVAGAACVRVGSTLAKIGPTPSDWSSVVYGVVALTLLLLIGAIAIMAARRLFFRPPASEEDTFSLHGIRQLLADGKISQEEYEHLRKQLINRFRADGKDAPEE